MARRKINQMILVDGDELKDFERIEDVHQSTQVGDFVRHKDTKELGIVRGIMNHKPTQIRVLTKKEYTEILEIGGEEDKLNVLPEGPLPRGLLGSLRRRLQDDYAPPPSQPETWAKTPETCAEEALRIVNGARQADYGHPFENHMRTAMLWGAYLGGFPEGHFITPQDVCMLNILQKISRQQNKASRDNITDIIGYAMNIDMIHLEIDRLRQEEGMTFGEMCEFDFQDDEDEYQYEQWD